MIVACPSCNIQLEIPEAFVGRTVKCSSCNNPFQAGAEPLAAAELYPDDRPSGRGPRREHGYDDEERWQRGPRRDLLPHRGGMVLTLGIISVSLSPLSFCGLFGFVFGVASLALGITGLVLGQTDLRQIDSHRMDPEGRGMTSAGWICAIIGTCISGLAMLIVLLIMVAWGSLFFHL
jgi:hypothetical protein